MLQLASLMNLMSWALPRAPLLYQLDLWKPEAGAFGRAWPGRFGQLPATPRNEFFWHFETSTRLPHWPAVTGAMGTTAAPMPTAAATSCAMPRSCEANESTFDLCDLWIESRFCISIAIRVYRCYDKYGFLLQISWSFFLMLGKSCSLSNNSETRIQNTAQITPKFCTPSCSSVLQARVWPPVAGGTRIKSNLAEMLHNFGA